MESRRRQEPGPAEGPGFFALFHVEQYAPESRARAEHQGTGAGRGISGNAGRYREAGRISGGAGLRAAGGNRAGLRIRRRGRSAAKQSRPQKKSGSAGPQEKVPWHRK